MVFTRLLPPSHRDLHATSNASHKTSLLSSRGKYEASAIRASALSVLHDMVRAVEMAFCKSGSVRKGANFSKVFIFSSSDSVAQAESNASTRRLSDSGKKGTNLCIPRAHIIGDVSERAAASISFNRGIRSS